MASTSPKSILRGDAPGFVPGAQKHISYVLSFEPSSPFIYHQDPLPNNPSWNSALPETQYYCSDYYQPMPVFDTDQSLCSPSRLPYGLSYSPHYLHPVATHYTRPTSQVNEPFAFLSYDWAMARNQPPGVASNYQFGNPLRRHRNRNENANRSRSRGTGIGKQSSNEQLVYAAKNAQKAQKNSWKKGSKEIELRVANV